MIAGFVAALFLACADGVLDANELFFLYNYARDVFSGNILTLSDYVRSHYHGCEKIPPEEWVTKYRPPYLVERKYDGIMVFAFKANNQVVLATKHNGTYTQKQVPNIISDLEQIFAEKDIETAVLHGEYIRETEELWVHDILFMRFRSTGEPRGPGDLTSLDLLTRKSQLGIVLDRDYTHVHKVECLVVHTAEEIQRCFEEETAAGHEGIVAKVNLPYTANGSSWMKMKAEVSIDCVITGTHLGEKGNTIYEISLHDEQDGLKIVSVGDVYSCLKGVDKSKLDMGTVIEVRCNKVWPTFRMRHPTIMRIRTDKQPFECLLKQMRDELKVALFGNEVASPMGVHWACDSRVLT